jgi:hypothetical protein
VVWSGQSSGFGVNKKGIRFCTLSPEKERGANFRFLREAARPDSEFIGWYEPTIGTSGSEPDFVLFGNSLGLLVLEVKDWDIDQIEEGNSHSFKIWIAGK